MEEEARGLMSTIKSLTTISKYTKYLDDSASILSNWGQFVAIFAIGVIIIIFSIPFATFLLINPKPFCMLFSLGSIVILVAMAQLVKPKDLVKKVGDIFGVLSYTFSLALSLYAGLFNIGYLYTIFAIITQLISLIYIVVSQFPGGKRGMKIVFNQAKNFSFSTFKSILGIKNQSFLPL